MSRFIYICTKNNGSTLKFISAICYYAKYRSSFRFLFSFFLYLSNRDNTVTISSVLQILIVTESHETYKDSAQLQHASLPCYCSCITSSYCVPPYQLWRKRHIISAFFYKPDVVLTMHLYSL